MEFKPASSVATAPIVAAGLVGGYLAARETGVRPIGGVVLAAAGGYAARTWVAKVGPAQAAALGAGYLAAFGASHPLAKKMGAWPAVFTAASMSAVTSWIVSDRR